MSRLRRRDAGRDVVRLRHVRLRERSLRPEADLRRVSDRGRRRSSFSTALVRRRSCCSLLGPFVAFFGTGYFSGFGAVTAEIYPTAIRATAQGFTYNIGRLASAAAPFVVGTHGADARLRRRVHDDAVAFLVAAAFWMFIPETRGRELHIGRQRSPDAGVIRRAPAARRRRPSRSPRARVLRPSPSRDRARRRRGRRSRAMLISPATPGSRRSSP